MEGLRIKKPENTLQNRIKMQKEIQQTLEERHKKHAKTLKIYVKENILIIIIIAIITTIAMQKK
jgi:hypothetical protein